MIPVDVQRWLDVAQERTNDTETLLEHRENSVGPVYLAGNVIELSLKALWQMQGRTPPHTRFERTLARRRLPSFRS